MHSVMIIEDAESDRARFRAALKNESEFLIVAEAEDARSGHSLALEHHPAIIVLDMGLPDHSGLSILPLLLLDSPRAVVLMTSQNENPLYVREAFRRGAGGFLPKNDIESRFIEALRTISGGGRFTSDASTARVLEAMEPDVPGATHWSRFPPRLKEVAYLGTLDLNAREIGEYLGISPRTVESYRSEIMMRTHSANLGELNAFVLAQIDPWKLTLLNGLLSAGRLLGKSARSSSRR